MIASEHPDNPKHFVTTHWSLVLKATKDNTEIRLEALDELCRTYWRPLYFFALRKGKRAHDAQDLVQGFFLNMIQKEFLSSADKEKGKFRTFLIVAFKRYMANQYDKETAKKRGGNAQHLSLDFETADQLYDQLNDPSQSPEKIYDRTWAMSVLNKVMELLSKDYAKRGKAALYEFLRSTLPGQTPTMKYEEAADKFGISNNTVKSEVHRLRMRFGQTMRELIANTVNEPSDIDQEMRYLMEAL